MLRFKVWDSAKNVRELAYMAELKGYQIPENGREELRKQGVKTITDLVDFNIATKGMKECALYINTSNKVAQLGRKKAFFDNMDTKKTKPDSKYVTCDYNGMKDVLAGTFTMPLG